MAGAPEHFKRDQFRVLTQFSVQLAEEQLEAANNGEPNPRVLLMAHRHKTGHWQDDNGMAIVTGAWQAAIADCTDTIQMAPMEADAYLLRAMTRFSVGDIDKALADALPGRDVPLWANGVIYQGRLYAAHGGTLPRVCCVAMAEDLDGSFNPETFFTSADID
jgi:hypothetical protein